MFKVFSLLLLGVALVLAYQPEESAAHESKSKSRYYAKKNVDDSGEEHDHPIEAEKPATAARKKSSYVPKTSAAVQTKAAAPATASPAGMIPPMQTAVDQPCTEADLKELKIIEDKMVAFDMEKIEDMTEPEFEKHLEESEKFLTTPGVPQKMAILTLRCQKTQAAKN